MYLVNNAGAATETHNKGGKIHPTKQQFPSNDSRDAQAGEDRQRRGGMWEDAPQEGKGAADGHVVGRYTHKGGIPVQRGDRGLKPTVEEARPPKEVDGKRTKHHHNGSDVRATQL